MTKAEVLSEIMYDLKLKGTADFEVDENHNYTVRKIDTGYQMEGFYNEWFYFSATEVRQAIRKLGTNLLQL